MLMIIIFQENKGPGFHFIKKNTVEVKIHPDHKVDDTFGYENWVVVSAKFSTLGYELTNLDRSNKPNKIDYCLSGQVILRKLNANTTEKRPDKPPKHSLKMSEGKSKINNMVNIMADQMNKDFFHFRNSKGLPSYKIVSQANIDLEFDEILERKPSSDSFDKPKTKDDGFDSFENMHKFISQEPRLTISMPKSRQASPTPRRSPTLINKSSPNRPFYYNISDHSDSSIEETANEFGTEYYDLNVFKYDIKYIQIADFIIK